MSSIPGRTSTELLDERARRRRFLANCAKFAGTAPPAVALLLSASNASAHHNPDHSGGPSCSQNPNPTPCR